MMMNEQLQGVDATVANKFPGKLWVLVNNSTSQGIKWGQKGKSVVVNPVLFEKEFLNHPDSLFKTSNISSFIRQLNLYGFRKVTAFRQLEEDEPKQATDGSEILEFYNEYFRRGCPQLLVKLRRNVGIRRSREIAIQRQIRKEIMQAEVARISAAGYPLSLVSYQQFSRRLIEIFI